ncbi:MAG: hypothetical protein Q9164_004650 [Protoblastenia rupestris]
MNSSLLKLPLELRIAICKGVFRTRDLLHRYINSHAYSLVMTSRQIYNETMHLYYQINITNPHKDLTWLPINFFQSIRNIDVHLDRSQMHDKDKYLTQDQLERLLFLAFLEQSRKLLMIMIRIDRLYKDLFHESVIFDCIHDDMQCKISSTRVVSIQQYLTNDN